MTSPASPNAEQILAANSQALVDHFQEVFARYPAAPPRLMESIAYSILAGGKRLRPTLILESATACGDNDPAPKLALTARKLALTASAAMELIHTFSLVHDDLPAMDNDDLRRGRPTNHKVFGEALAILAGDAMVTMAFELLATDVPPQLAAPMIRELASGSGPAGMIGGQVLDMDSENTRLSLDQLKRLHRMKTGALLTSSCRLGAIAAYANPEQLDAVTRFGQHLGLAFQIVDDILDETSTPEQMGKATKKDAAKGKNTYPALLGLDGSRTEADKQMALALEALAPLGPAAAPLRAVARFVVDRNH